MACRRLEWFKQNGGQPPKSLKRRKKRTPAYNLVLGALRRADIPLETESTWDRATYKRAKEISRSTLVSAGYERAHEIARVKLRLVIQNNKITVAPKTGTTATTATTTSATTTSTTDPSTAVPGAIPGAVTPGSITQTPTPGGVPPNFTAKRSQVRKAFLAARKRHKAAFKARQITETNNSASNRYALDDVKDSGLPTELLRFSDKGLLIASPSAMGWSFVGSNIDTAVTEEQDWINQGRFDDAVDALAKAGHPYNDERSFFDEGDDWIDEDDVEPEAKKLDEEAEKEADLYGTTEEDLWLRPALAGDDPLAAVKLTATWWQPLSWFMERASAVIASQKTLPVGQLPAQAAGGGGGGGGGGGSKGGGGEGKGEGEGEGEGEEGEGEGGGEGGEGESDE